MTKTDEKTKATATPMMQQYLAIKEKHQDYLLFYRMGDFYELFFEDAVVAAEALDIALTKRGKHGDEDIPMCGVPHHSHESYLQRLIRSGFKVAICEQMESPEEAKKRGYKAVVKRDVVRIVTPGTVTEDALLETKESSYLVACCYHKDEIALSWLDITTGEFKTCLTSKQNLSSELSRLNPKEVLLADNIYDDPSFRPIWDEWQEKLTPHVNNFFDKTRAEARLKKFYDVECLDAYGDFTEIELAACGALLEYVELTQRGEMPRLDPPKQEKQQHYMIMDAATRRNLELVATMSGERKGSLLSVIDKTVTGAGSRKLMHHLSAPLVHADSINARLELVQFFVEETALRQNIREILKRTPDLERALSRICIGRGTPRDLIHIRTALKEAALISETIACADVNLPARLASYLQHLTAHDILLTKLEDALKDEVGALLKDGGFVRPGYHEQLDSLHNLQQNSKERLTELRDKYREQTGITTLKVTQNNVLGYYIEVTPQHHKKMECEPFTHRQTLANAVRFTSDELKQLEQDIVTGKDQILQIEFQIFEQMIQEVASQADTLALAAQGLASFDVIAGLAQLAVDQDYSKPKIDNSTEFEIKDGRHPVVEASLEKGSTDFVPNDCDLSQQQRVWLLTGPNMAGKSTYLRQNALITLMAQIGSYVPAKSAHIGTVDRVFSRVGAADDLARGRSTFMVEMVETATILNQATPRSLVILDEIGRGTATFDGLSIAWSCIEHLHTVSNCRTLFATHYHELTALTTKLASLACYTIKVKEWQDKIVFLHQVIKGAAERSYGIHVAKLAGLPKAVTKRAEQVLAALSDMESRNTLLNLSDELPLFAMGNDEVNDTPEVSIHSEASPLEEEFAKIDVDDLTPKQALDVLYRLKELAE